jgi:Tol biopolymer transport system component
MGPVFSPDGSRIANTVNDGKHWDTWEVPALRGEPRRWLRNASGLTWIGTSDLLFSELKNGSHMAIVRSNQSRADTRDLYVPSHENGMAHRSYASPDGKWVLLVEMDESLWVSCRLVSMDGASSRAAGPSKARCTNAAWSPDGRIMYFSADAGDGFHIWRQHFPDGQPEQLTSGPTEEEGLAVAPDGKSLITSVGLAQRSVWFHDASGERQISLEGYAYWPLISADGRRICFRVSHSTSSGQSPTELWMVETGSGQKQRLFPGQLITGYDLSPDDRVVASILETDGRTRVWLAWLDGREPPRRIPQAEGDNPRFARNGEIIFRVPEKNTGVVYRIREDGGSRTKIIEGSGTAFGTVSPDGEWFSARGGAQSKGLSVYSTSGRTPIRILPYSQSSRLRWGTDGKHVYLSIQYGQASAFAVGRTYALPLAGGAVLPVLPPGGFRTEAEVAALPGVEILPYGDLTPGASPSVYAFSRVTTTRNLYRIPLR